MRNWFQVFKDHGHDVWMPTNFDTHKFPKNVALEMQAVTRPIHFQKIKNLKDGVVFVVNKDGYIGAGTFAEITYCYILNNLHGHRNKIYTIEPLDPESTFYEELANFGTLVYDRSLEV